MAWKTLGLSVAEFAGGLGTLRMGVPAENILLTCIGTGLALLGLFGLVRPLSKPQRQEQRPYL